MGLFKKKEKIPTIPTAPSIPTLPELPPLKSATEEPIKGNLPGLPSFPASAKNETLNQEIVKSAVSDTPSNEEAESDIQAPASINVEEFPEKKPTLSPKEDIQSSIPKLPKLITPVSLPVAEPQKSKAPITPITPIQSTTPQEQSVNQNKPIFVRIDKFQAAQKNFDEIKFKIAEIELVLQKIKDVKSKEDEELKGWTEDMEKLKSRLTEIDSGIFSQL